MSSPTMPLLPRDSVMVKSTAIQLAHWYSFCSSLSSASGKALGYAIAKSSKVLYLKKRSCPGCFFIILKNVTQSAFSSIVSFSGSFLSTPAKDLYRKLNS